MPTVKIAVYSSTCPHCGQLLDVWNSRDFYYQLRAPFRKCSKCSEELLDSRAVEWEMIDSIVERCVLAFVRTLWGAGQGLMLVVVAIVIVAIGRSLNLWHFDLEGLLNKSALTMLEIAASAGAIFAAIQLYRQILLSKRRMADPAYRSRLIDLGVRVPDSRVRHVARLTHRKVDCRRLQFSADGEIIYGISDGAIAAWDGATGSLLNELKTREGYAYASVVRESGDGLAFIRDLKGQSFIHRWDRNLQESREPLFLEIGPVVSASFNRDGSVLAIAELDGNIGIRNVETGAEFFGIRATSRVMYLNLAPDGGRLFVVTDGRRPGEAGSGQLPCALNSWDVGSTTLIGLTYWDLVPTAIDSTPNGSRVLLGFNPYANVIDPVAGASIQKLHGSASVSVCFSADGHMALTADAEMVRVWDVESGKLLRSVASRLAESIRSIAVHPKGDSVMTSHISHVYFSRLWDLNLRER